MRRSRILAVLLGMLLATASMSAVGGQPLFMDKVGGSEGPFVDPVLLDWCGTEILITFDWKGKITVFDDNTTRQHINYDWIMFNPANGSTVIESAAFNWITPPVMELVDEELGTLTWIFEDTFIGLTHKWRQPGVGVLLRDAGTMTFQLTLVFELNTMELLDESFNIMANGPHPFTFMSDPERAEIICGALTN